MLPRRKAKASSALGWFAPSPPESELRAKEKGFVLDCVAVQSIAKDYSFSLPKLGSVIPPYNSQKDPHVSAYFKSTAVPRLLRKTGQSKGGTSILGHLADNFQVHGPAALYLSIRNSIGSGHSTENLKGHSLVSVKPMIGYSGNYGYRRNVPTLRKMPSSFGLVTKSAIN